MMKMQAIVVKLITNLCESCKTQFILKR